MAGDHRSTRLPGWLWVVPILFLAVWASSYPIIKRCFPQAVDAGGFGDSFGAVNALFSAFALGGVIFAIILQRQELIAQRDELELTRRELRGQKLQLQAQNLTLARQAFDSTFFALVRLLSEIVASVDIGLPTDKRYIKGRDCFSTFCNIIGAGASERVRVHRVSHPEAVSAVYPEFIQRHGRDVGHYFRTLEVVLLYLRDNEVGALGTYVRVLRAQISEPELTLLWYHAATRPAGDEFRALLQSNMSALGLADTRLIDPADTELWPEVHMA